MRAEGPNNQHNGSRKLRCAVLCHGVLRCAVLRALLMRNPSDSADAGRCGDRCNVFVHHAQSVPAFVTSWGHSDCSTVKTTLAQSAAFQLMPVSRLAIVEYLGSADRLPNTVTCELRGAGQCESSAGSQQADSSWYAQEGELFLHFANGCRAGGLRHPAGTAIMRAPTAQGGPAACQPATGMA